MDMMSSDESEGEVIKVKELPWRSSKVEEIFNIFDEENERQKSSQAMRQTKKRVLRGISERSVPTGVPSWALKKV